LYFQLFFLFTNIPVQSYSSLRVLRRSILTAGVPPPNDGCLFVDKPPPSISTLRDFVAAFAGPFLRRLCDLPFLYVRFHHYERFHFIVIEITLHHYERLHFIVTRDYTSLLLRLHFIITRDYTSSLREITLHHYERLHFIITRDYTSSLREIKYLNYTTRRLFLP